MMVVCSTCQTENPEAESICTGCGSLLTNRSSSSSPATTALADRSLADSTSAEEDDLKEHESRLGALEAEVADRELELETLRAEMHVFEIRYLRAVGTKYAELDRLRARIAELRAKADPENQAKQEEAERATAQAEETESAQADIDPGKAIPSRFEASDSLKKLYRELAKKIYPDFAVDEEDRQRRTKLMAELNIAFEAGDEERIKQLSDEWEERPEAVTGDTISAKLQRIQRKISAIQNRLGLIRREWTILRSSNVYGLLLRVEEAERFGRDLLADMAFAVQQEIEQAQFELDSIA